LQTKLIELQEELTRSYRLNSEHSATLLRLKDRAEQDEHAIVERDERVKKLNDELRTAQEQVELTVATTAGLQRSVEVLRDEVTQLRVRIRFCDLMIFSFACRNNIVSIRKRSTN
jgi:chromosome segregation ATPase